MQRYSLTCACGEQMLVPESAIGRKGMCPACGADVSLDRSKLQRYAPPAVARERSGGLLRRNQHQKAVANNEPREESWRKFAHAVDLYNQRRYAEALTLLSALQQAYPGNASIDAAQAQCAEALREATSPTLGYDGRAVDEQVLNEDLVRSVVLNKLLNGTTEAIQLQAAELAARMLGMLRPDTEPVADPPVSIVLTPPPAMENVPPPTQRPARRKRAGVVEEFE